MHNVETMRGDLLAFSRGVRATVRLLANTSGLSEYLPRALAAFLSQHPHISIDVEERESGDIAHAIATGAADLGLAAEHALPDGIERIPFSASKRRVKENPPWPGWQLPFCGGLTSSSEAPRP